MEREPPAADQPLPATRSRRALLRLDVWLWLGLPPTLSGAASGPRPEHKPGFERLDGDRLTAAVHNVGSADAPGSRLVAVDGNGRRLAIEPPGGTVGG